MKNLYEKLSSGELRSQRITNLQLLRELIQLGTQLFLHVGNHDVQQSSR
jgi:hypothetical protein